MPPAIQVGSILIEDGPLMTQRLAIESQPYSGTWSLIKVLDALALDRKMHAAGWNFFFMAAETKAMFLGALSADKVRNALQRILGKVKQQHFNGLEVTQIAARRFLGVPYTVVSAHSRHIQQSCYLDSIEARRTSQHNAEWGKA